MTFPSRTGYSGLVVFVLLLAVGGCKSPSAANIELRKQNQGLRDQVAKLETTQRANLATIHALETKATTVPVLPQERSSKLFTVYGIKLGRLTGGADLDSEKPGDEALKVYVTPTDESGETLKAAGAFEVEAFDLDSPDRPQVGRWTFPVEESQKNWIAYFTHAYVLTCRFENPPRHGKLAVQVHFTDELTLRTFTADTFAQVTPAPATSRPATRP